MSKARTAAQAFLDEATKYGFTVVVASQSVVRLTKTFQPNDAYAYVSCDMMAPGILAMAPLKGGSVWGSDGSGIGGQVALTSGKFTLNKSGEGKRFMAALAGLNKS